MNLHLSKHTLYQVGNLTVFDEYPLYIRKGRFTNTIFFDDRDAVLRMMNALHDILDAFNETIFDESDYDLPF